MGVTWGSHHHGSGKWACAICKDRLGLLERLADVRICADCQNEFPILTRADRSRLGGRQ